MSSLFFTEVALLAATGLFLVYAITKFQKPIVDEAIANNKQRTFGTNTIDLDLS